MIPVITFGVSLAAIIAILVYQTRQINLNKVAMVYDDPFDWPGLQNKITNWMADFSRGIIVSLLRLYIRAAYFVKEQRGHSRRQFEIVRQKIKRFLDRKKSGGPVSEFLATIGEYKEHIQKIKKEIEEEKKN
jgi:hypothetical protein